MYTRGYGLDKADLKIWQELILENLGLCAPVALGRQTIYRENK